MKKLLFPFLVFFATVSSAQQSGTMFVAAKSGLTFREGPTTNSKAIDNIPYGTKITIIRTEDETINQVTENMLGYWQKIRYNNKTGYILDAYLFPWTPPKLSTVKEMRQYLAQITTPFGSKLTVKSGNQNHFEEMGWEIKKQLYKNGAEWHQNLGHEYGSDVYFLPGFSIQQGFLLLRLIPEFKNAIGENDAFPTENKTYKRGEEDFKIIVDKEVYEEGYPWFRKIQFEYADGAFYDLQLYMMDNQLVISFSSGV